MAWFRDIKTLQKFDAAHASTHNHFNQDRHLTSRGMFKKNPLRCPGRVASTGGLNEGALFASEIGTH